MAGLTLEPGKTFVRAWRTQSVCCGPRTQTHTLPSPSHRDKPMPLRPIPSVPTHPPALGLWKQDFPSTPLGPWVRLVQPAWPPRRASSSAASRACRSTLDTTFHKIRVQLPITLNCLHHLDLTVVSSIPILLPKPKIIAPLDLFCPTTAFQFFSSLRPWPLSFGALCSSTITFMPLLRFTKECSPQRCWNRCKSVSLACFVSASPWTSQHYVTPVPPRLLHRFRDLEIIPRG